MIETIPREGSVIVSIERATFQIVDNTDAGDDGGIVAQITPMPGYRLVCDPAGLIVVVRAEREANDV